ncbi:MAG: Tetratricopeptide repeat protein [Candidatus Scalindua rubra]|uniref:Tetratricopeptide repeat protein n=1 Tax=Candidatus Scalindua rubra TaxID=1872076 RepID=A0A1E3X2E1_9BACT|nr:MAG: Tetratricopeptide repeat protein [Candidatus Scalindua rubra]
MNKLLILIISFVFVCPMFGCAPEQYVKRTTKVPHPEWVDKVPDEDENYHYFVGRRTHASTYESGWDDAFQNAISKISRMIQSRVTVDYDKQRYERDIVHDIEIHDTSSYVRDRVRILSSEIARGVKEAASHYEEARLENAIRYNVYVLVRYPKDEYVRIKNKILGIEPEIEEGRKWIVSGKYKEAIDHFSTITIKEPRNKEAHYYLALSYDKYGNKREALKAYKDFLDMHPIDKILVNKSTNRIRELREEIIKELIEEANTLANRHEYEDCLEKLEQAYDLRPPSAMANKIVERYSTYSISSIAWEMSTNSDSLQEKTVSVVPFTSLSGEESTQGNAVAAELRNVLVNFQKLKVYIRDDDSIKAILKEIEFGQTGAIDEKTRKELGKLINTEAIVTGRVGYVANTFKINGWMINVETGRIVSSKSVKMLGWNIDDTDESADFKISVWMDRKVYNIGDTVTINLTSNRDCYVTLLNVRSNGEIWELFPNRYNTNNFIKANVRHTIPSNNDNFRLAIVEPPGKEYIKAVATTVPITNKQIKQVLSEDTSILVASADVIGRGSDSAFRSVSPSEMRGLHEILERGVGAFPISENDPEYKQVGYYESTPQFDHAVSTWSFETRR